MKNLLFLIDGSYYLYRSYYGIKPIFSKKGKLINAIHGILNILSKIIIKYKPNYLALVFDSNIPTFRKKLFYQYKSHRNPMPQDLKEQIPILFKILKILGFPLIKACGVEADDVIGTLAEQAKKKCLVLISTSDKDFLQLINKNIKIIYNNDILIGKKEIKKKYGISSKKLIDFFSLIGDKTDNIPGVPGIGEKTALILLKKFKNLHEIYNNLEKISLFSCKRSKNIIKILKENKKIAFLSYKLINLKKDVPLNIFYNDLKITLSNKIKILKLIHHYGIQINTLILENLINYHTI